jgi:hypothetical protein
MRPEFRRGMLYAVNPVGFGSMIISAGVSIVGFFGGLGPGAQPYSPLVAIVLALVLPPVLAVATRGRYYLRRTDDGIDAPMYDEHGNPSGESCSATSAASRSSGPTGRCAPTTRSSARCA